MHPGYGGGAGYRDFGEGMGASVMVALAVPVGRVLVVSRKKI